MLLLQAALMWSGLLLIADGARTRGLPHPWLVVAIGFLPPILGIEGEIWKDVQFAASLLCGFAIVYRLTAAGRPMHPAWALVALVPLFYATAIRANAAAAALPIAAYWAHGTLRRASLRQSIVAGATLVAAMLAIQLVVDRVVLDARREYLSQFLAVFDIAAIRCAGGDAGIPSAMLRADASPAAVCAEFDPYKVDFLFAPAGAPLARTADAAVVAALWTEWRRAVIANPARYVEHRLRAFRALLGFGTYDDDVRRPVWIPSSIPNAHGFTFVPNAATDLIGVGARAARAARLYNGLPWLAIAVVVLAAVGRRARRSALQEGPAVLAASALMYTLPYVVVAIAPDYRYLYWTVVASAVAGMLSLLPTRAFTALVQRCESLVRPARRAGSEPISR
jgi:hypothetical protein